MPRRRSRSASGCSTLPRSSWDDYDRALISPGGGVFPRTAKSIPITPEVRARLGIADGVDVLHARGDDPARSCGRPSTCSWNGGIGTYVKAHAETHADVGDKANDAVRVDGAELRAASSARAATSASRSGAGSSSRSRVA